MMDDYGQFVAQVYRKTGINLADYKEAQMKRRLTSFRDREQYASFHDMLEAFNRDPTLLERFLNRITINVSEFFRNPERWQSLQKEVLPVLASNRAHLKCWSAACSTGEEPYTLAMILKEMGIPFELLATDIDRSVLERAKTGEYGPQAVRHVPRHFREQYFIPLEDNRFRVKAELKRGIRFFQHDLLQDAYPEGCHLIVCRNVMIYFTDEAKARIYRAFSDSLVPGGVLFVGSTEQILRPADYGLAPLAPFMYQRVSS